MAALDPGQRTMYNFFTYLDSTVGLANLELLLSLAALGLVGILLWRIWLNGLPVERYRGLLYAVLLGLNLGFGIRLLLHGVSYSNVVGFLSYAVALVAVWIKEDEWLKDIPPLQQFAEEE